MRPRLGTDHRGAVMVEYAVVLLVATLVAAQAMYMVGKPMAEQFVWAQGILLYPI
ncbi:MAG: hypothetical protein R3A78_01780 [Polyangiales bacterium]|nr:hypothetical protein [Myxococcales bacterium]